MSSLFVDSIIFTISSGTSTSLAASFAIFTRAILEFMARDPPFKTTTLPALKESARESIVTFGLASYIIAITPIGTLTFSIYSPFGLFHPSITSPIGSGSATISSMDPAISWILFSVRRSLSTKDSFVPFSLAYFTSFSFSESI